MCFIWLTTKIRKKAPLKLHKPPWWNQGLLRLGIGRILVLGEEFVVQDADDLTGLDGHFQFLLEVDVGIVHEERQAVVFFLQVLQLDDLRRIVGALHVVDLEGAEVAGDDPARSHGQWQPSGIAAGLLVGREFRTVGLAVLGGQIYVRALLLDEDLGGCDVPVNEVGALPGPVLDELSGCLFL